MESLANDIYQRADPGRPSDKRSGPLSSSSTASASKRVGTGARVHTVSPPPSPHLPSPTNVWGTAGQLEIPCGWWSTCATTTMTVSKNRNASCPLLSWPSYSSSWGEAGPLETRSPALPITLDPTPTKVIPPVDDIHARGRPTRVCVAPP